MVKIITAFFTKNNVPKTGLIPTIKIWEITSISNTLIVNGSVLSEIGDGFYKYIFNSYDDAKNYIFMVDGGTSLGGSERYSISGNESYSEDITNSVWNEQASLHDTAGTMGSLQNDIGDALVIVNEILKFDRNRTKIDKINKTLTVYDNDGTTPIRVFDLKNDSGVSSITEIFERIPV